MGLRRDRSVFDLRLFDAARHALFRVTLLGALFTGSSALAGEAAAALSGVDLAGSFAAALENATATKRPILVILHTDAERGCGEMERSVYRSRDFLRAAKRFVVVVASPDEHTADSRCDRFLGIDCRAHSDNFDRLFERYFVGAENVVIPQHLVLAPDGGLISRLEYVRTEHDLLRAMESGEKYAADPAKAVRSHESEVVSDLQTLNAKSGAVAEKAGKRLLSDLETVYAPSTIAAIAAKGTPKAKRVLLKLLPGVPQHADALFVALLDDQDSKIREEAAVAVRDFPVICSAARAKLRAVAASGG